MPFYAVAFPKLSPADAAWLKTYREKNDSAAAARIGPHFSFVFGIDCSEQVFLEEIEKQLSGVAPIAFELRLATLNLDPRTGLYLEHLVPEAGYSEMVLLHDRLYRDRFTAHQRLDLGYVPHITIGRCEKPIEGKARTVALNARGIGIKGRIAELTVFEEDSKTDNPVATFPLEG